MIDWDDLQYVLAVARHGSLSAAARVLGVTQPTMGRRIAAFEARLGAQLFARSTAGWALSDVGRAVVEHAEHMQEHAVIAESLASGRHAGIGGPVRITAAEWLIRSVLGPLLGPLLARHRGLCIELVGEARHVNLARREADIALRPSRFTHQDVFQHAVATIEFGLYASDAYLARHGTPDFARGCEGHSLIAMTDDTNRIVDHDWLPRLAARARLAVRSNGREPMATMAAAGIGITVLPCYLGDATPGLRRLATPTPGPTRQLWLGVHRAARTTPRIRATVAFLTERLGRLRETLRPTRGEGDAA